MFDGDEDFFEDDDFLQDVFQLESTAADKITTPKENTNIKQTNASTAKLYSLDQECVQKQGNIIKKNDGIGNKKETSINKYSTNSTDVNKYIIDDSFEFGDDFPIDDLISVEKLNGQTTVLGTPPDSDFTKPQVSLSAVIEKNGSNKSATQNRSGDSKTDFRSKILKTLSETKRCGTSSQDFIHTTVLQDSTKNNTQSTYRPEKRKVPLDDIEKSNFPLVKRQNTTENYGLLSSHEPPYVTTTSTEHYMIERSTSNNTVNRNPREEGKPFSFSTPVKPLPASIRTTRSPGGPLIQKRKFPGPAGILPELGSGITESSIQKLQEKASPVPAPQEVVCSQSSASDFTCGPWQQMLNDMELDNSDPKCILKVFNIKWVLRRASLRGQAAIRKVPFLAVMLRNLDVTHVDATALLRDKSGEMNATIASSVLEEYGHTLQTGSVLLLRGVTVLSPVGVRTTSREHSRKHYLNITVNTIMTIYTPDDSGNVVRTLISEVDKSELYKEAAAPKSAACSRAIVEEEEDEIVETTPNHNQSLFSVNESFAQKSSYPNQGIYNQQQMPAYKSPRIGNNTPNFTPRFQSKVNSPVPGVNSPQARELCQPRIMAPAMHRAVTRPQRPPSLGQCESPFQNTNESQKRSSFSFRPRPQVMTSTPSNSSISSNNHKHLKEADEKELNDLLDGVDAESLFGDF